MPRVASLRKKHQLHFEIIPCEKRLTLRSSQLHLDVVGIAECKHVNTESVRVLDLPMRDTTLIKDFERFFEFYRYNLYVRVRPNH
jgi:hypothetical protein